MKKSIFVLAGLAMLALASCKKDYVCKCEADNEPLGGTISVGNVKKKDAKELCQQHENQVQDLSDLGNAINGTPAQVIKCTLD